MMKPQPKLEVERLLSWPTLCERGASDSELLMAQVPVRRRRTGEAAAKDLLWDLARHVILSHHNKEPLSFTMDLCDGNFN